MRADAVTAVCRLGAPAETVLMAWCKAAMANGLRVCMGACFGSLPVAGIVAVGPDEACECLAIVLKTIGGKPTATARVPTKEELLAWAALLPA